MAKEKAMSVKVQVSEVIEKPVDEVFRFYALEHVRNHPRWDPFMQLEQVTDGSIGIGTIIKRINSRSGQPVEGTMEVVEFEPDRAIGMITHDGPVEIHGRVTFEAVREDQTRLTLHVEFLDLDESMGSMMKSAIQKGYKTIKQLIESEVSQ
jgi:uncharacterized membrane protein